MTIQEAIVEAREKQPRGEIIKLQWRCMCNAIRRVIWPKDAHIKIPFVRDEGRLAFIQDLGVLYGQMSASTYQRGCIEWRPTAGDILANDWEVPLEIPKWDWSQQP